jgi:hypothetical protein
MWLGGEDQETWLGYDGPDCKCEGQVKGFGVIACMWWTSLSKDFAPMDQGNNEEQAKLRSMNQ